MLSKAQYVRLRRMTRKAEALKILGGCCVVCKTTENLEFDHKDPKTKIAPISSAKILDAPKDRFYAEVNKCQLLCKKHHLEKSKTNKELGRKYPAPLCGAGARYGLGCRCDLCVSWKKEYRAGNVDYQGSKIINV